MKKIFYFIKLEYAKLLMTLGYRDKGEALWQKTMAQINITNNSSVLIAKSYSIKPALVFTGGWDDYYSSRKIRFFATNFWDNFGLNDGFIKYLLDTSFPNWEMVSAADQADLIFTSTFPHTVSQYPEKTLAIIWENIRPDYRFYRFSLSSDFDNYGGRNCRCPFWFAEIQWSSAYKRAALSGGGAHGREPLVSLDHLMAPRDNFIKRKKFCAFVAGNPEPHRMMAVEALNDIASVDIYGPISGKLEERSKYIVLKDYVFSLCFENSMFPGYYTEKLLQAWSAGTIPLYFADSRIDEDFNVNSFINKNNYKSMDDFIGAVSQLYHDNRAMEDIWRQPLIMKKPSIDPVIEFIRYSTYNIINGK